jgi:hypothetical protein
VTRPAGPLSSGERASIARLLEASRDALDDQRIGHDNQHRLAGYLVARFDAAALAVRQGHRSHVLDRIVAELDRYRDQLAEEGDRP